MLRSHLRQMARQVAQLEAQARPLTEGLGWSIDQQAQACRSLLAACACGYVERTPEGYRAVTDPSRTDESFEIEPGRWDKRSLIVPKLAERTIWIAEFLTTLFQETGKYFPVYKGIADQRNPQFLEAVYRHYARRIFG